MYGALQYKCEFCRVTKTKRHSFMYSHRLQLRAALYNRTMLSGGGTWLLKLQAGGNLKFFTDVHQRKA